MIIPIDFVAGTHGNFLEIILNKFFNIVPVDFDPFNSNGASHVKQKQYLDQRLFVARHWTNDSKFDQLKPDYDRVISIQFDQDDILLVCLLSFWRAEPHYIDVNFLEIDTYSKLDNTEYRHMLNSITDAYPFLKRNTGSIPRNVLREFFKFGFLTPEQEGCWRKLQELQYNIPSFVFKFKAFYDRTSLVTTLKQLEEFLGMSFNFDKEFDCMHEKFLSLNPYRNHQSQCDAIITAVESEKHQLIPPLTLLQESYINAQLEKIYKKEMPFHDLIYFTSTKDVLNYLKT
jgi:hypothetical protein